MKNQTDTNNPLEPANKIQESSQEFWLSTKDFLYRWIDLSGDLDRPGTINSIQNNKKMHGANAWLLMCSIMVASLGLNLNSPAVIIGAMLISPLMSPILGVGLSIGINDRDALYISLKHFAMSIVIALATSILYFSLTPISEITNEIAARTEPGILDVLVAVFGGLAGIISGSRTDKSNAIPGVAIATALMPPLCVTGYGIALGEWQIAFNSFYLFFMNATFIALTTYLLVTFMNFPKKKYETKKERIRIQRFLAIFAIIMLLPSVYIFTKVLDKTQQRQKITNYINEKYPNSILRIHNEINNDDTISVKLFVFEDIPDDELDGHYKNLEALNCKAHFSIVDAQDGGISQEEFENTRQSLENTLLQKVQEEKAKVENERKDKIVMLETRLDSLKQDTVIFRSAAQELKAVFPLIEEVRYARMQAVGENSKSGTIPTFLVNWSKRKSTSGKKRDEALMYDFLKLRVNLDTLQIVRF